MIQSLGLTDNEVDIVGHIVDDMESSLQTDREAALADMRYEYIEKLCNICVKKSGEIKGTGPTVKIDTYSHIRYLLSPSFW